eukprot:4533944-Prymnesium_polylepis.3
MPADAVALHLPMRHASMHAYCRSVLGEGWLGRTERVGRTRSRRDYNIISYSSPLRPDRIIL